MVHQTQDKFAQSISKLPPQLGLALLPIINERFTGHITAKQIKHLQTVSGLPANTLIFSMLPIAEIFSQTPISNFKVGAIVKGISGDIYMGANFEFSKASLSQSIHAEQSAISHAWMLGENQITDVFLNYPPCGHCRQFINEMANGSNVLFHLPEQKVNPLSYYLPDAFSPSHLGITMPLFSSEAVKLKIENKDPLIAETTLQACKSYAPYTGCHAAVSLELHDDKVIYGRYIENVAFNPSLPPMQVALCGLKRMNKDFSEIKRAVLVESSAGKISLANVSINALHDVANIQLEHVTVEPE
ncbi:cytidine deaminase [Parashewanella tropica]|uniref:cytidine deaminase n=1 Tax=Parashewanella tropica TaxID=2547970 RepID=UPI001FEC2458|nr:cytidine deaminase [Parashewanella tropica]